MHPLPCLLTLAQKDPIAHAASLFRFVGVELTSEVEASIKHILKSKLGKTIVSSSLQVSLMVMCLLPLTHHSMDGCMQLPVQFFDRAFNPRISVK
jgi:hypothetical protein